jgi:hypothetical protein
MNMEGTTTSPAPRDWNRGPTHHSLGLCPCDLIKIREVTGARGLAMIYFRAVAQLGRAPGSGLLLACFDYFMRLYAFSLVSRGESRLHR